MGLIILVQGIEGVFLMPIIIQFTCTTPLRAFQKTFGLHNICFRIYKGIALP
jgi:hypothetical protein